MDAIKYANLTKAVLTLGTNYGNYAAGCFYTPTVDSNHPHKTERAKRKVREEK